MTDLNATPSVSLPIADPSKDQAPSVLLMGGISSGKTSTIETILAAGLEVFYLALEPGFIDVFGKFKGGMPPPNKLHWHYIPPVQDDMNVVMKKIELIRDNDDKALKGMGGVNKARHTQILDFMKQCNNFEDQRTGVAYGDFATWGSDRALVIDGLSGLTTMAEKLKIGDKPYMEQNDYYAVQTVIEDIVNTIVANSKCLFVLIAHQEWETNPQTGLNQLMASTSGKALAPILPRPFSDAIVTKKTLGADGKTLKFHWDNVDPSATVKFRNLPPGNQLEPSFGPLIDNWRKKVTYEAKP